MKQIKQSAVNSNLLEAVLITIDQVELILQDERQIEDLQKLQLVTDSMKLPVTIHNISTNKWLVQLEQPYPFGKSVYVKLDNCSYSVHIGKVVRSHQFDQHFYYPKDDLGIQYRETDSHFAVWSPVALLVELILFKNWYEEKGEVLSLTRDATGVWRTVVERNVQGYCYQYRVTHAHEIHCVIDPYAKYLTIDGIKAIIEPDPKPLKPQSLPALKKEQTIIYEVHLRDFTQASSSGVKNKGKYKGFIEHGTINAAGQSTGLDYLQELGITHVQLMPIFDFATVQESNINESYNWGYDTTHFFALEGSYSLNAYCGVTRVEELQELVLCLHQKQVRVIIDVVYNHLYIWENTALEKLVPGYYFRYDEEGTISNGTGVGNDFASERKMARKLMIDSITYLIKTFDVDGLRFDLMGILDVQTMKQISETVQTLKNDVLLLGEGWEMPTHLSEGQMATIEQASQLPNISFFDDHFRDLIKGSTFTECVDGFVLKGVEPSSIQEVISGSPARYTSPLQAIHYIEVHDNQTLWDHLIQRLKGVNADTIERYHRLMTSIVLLSQGIPFLHAGQEWCRTKFGCSNSYNTPDWTNEIDWKRRTLYNDYVHYVRGLIQIRKTFPIFSLSTYEEIEQKIDWLISESQYIVYELSSGIQHGKNSIKTIIAHNATTDRKTIECERPGIWQVYVDEKAASLVPLYSLCGKELIVQPLSTLVCSQVM